MEPSASTGPAGTDGEVLAGFVERVTYHNAENGFCVLRVKARGLRDLATVVGHAATISAGEWVSAGGEWVNDRTHGQQFRARWLRSSAPTTAEGILVALHQRVGGQAVADIGAGQDRAAHQVGAEVDREMRLVAEEAALAAPGEAGVRVERRDFALALRRAGDRGLHQRRVDQRAGLQHQALGVELAVQLGEERLGEAPLGQSPTEAAERGLVRRAVIQPEAAEAAEGQAVRQRLLEAGVGELAPLGQQQRPEQRQRRVAGPPGRRPQRGEQTLHRLPVDQAGDALQPAVQSGTRRQQRLREAALPDTPLAQPCLRRCTARALESGRAAISKAFRRGLL